MDLLNTVQPSSGWFCVLGIKGKKVDQHLVETREEVDKLVENFVADNWDVYFGVAKFGSGGNRTKDNVHLLKSFWVDIDCGEAKAVVSPETGKPDGYIDQATGLKALKDFCEKIGLPDPIVVNSGRGIHAYWPLLEELTRQEWQPVARRLRELCITHNFYIDPVVFEASRVLRVPNTFNFKDNPPKEVTVLEEAEPTSITELRKILGVKENDVEAPKREMSEMAKAMQANYASSFNKIMKRGNDGCKQLISCYQDRASLSEPRWFNALSIAKFCSEKDVAIHKLSQDHPDYDPATTEEKIEHIKGPHSCVEFDKANPGVCDGCAHKGTIKSPIQLGREILEATEEDNTVVVPSEEEGEEDETITIPKYPEPYFRGQNGGVYIRVKKDPDEEGPDPEPIRIYEYDLYVVKRMHDPHDGEVAVVRAHLPKDGVREFVIPAVHIADVGEVKKDLAKNGVITTKKKFEAIANYIIAGFQDLQYRYRAEIMRTQFGWTKDESKFIVGDKELSAVDTYYSPPSKITRPLAQYMHSAGTLDKWKEVFSHYGKEGLEPHAFAALTAFGSPLLKFTGQSGAVINLINSKSGTGKSTILYMINSVFGHPKHLCGIPKDTTNATFYKLGVMGNIAYTLDEVTNMTPRVYSDVVYGISQGSAKDRLNANADLKTNDFRWQLTAVMSSNASFYEKLATIKTNPDGEFMRILEYQIDPSSIISPQLGKEIFDRDLMQNYGHAGELYMKFIIGNLEEVKDCIKAVQQKIDDELRLSAKERFWSAVVASNLTGGWYAKKLGLIDWNMQAIYAWATNLIQDLRKDTEPPVLNTTAVLAEYLNSHLANMVVINENVDSRTNPNSPPSGALCFREPRDELKIRYEPDTNYLYISSKHFKEYCVTFQINHKDTLKALEQEGILRDRAFAKRLTKGLKVVSGATRCLWLDCNNSGFFDVGAQVIPDDNRESAV